MCASCRCHFHFYRVTSTRLQADNLLRLMNWRCRFCNGRPDLVPNHPGAETRLDKQYQGYRQDKLVILQWNANGILREVAALETVLASLQADAACIQDTKHQPKDNTPEINQYSAFSRGRQIQGEARGGSLIIYVRATPVLSAIHPAVETSNVLEKLAVVTPLPGQQNILVSNWYLPPETSNFLRRAGFSDSDSKQNSNSLKLSVPIRTPMTHSGIQLPDLQKEENFSDRRCWMLSVLS